MRLILMTMTGALLLLACATGQSGCLTVPQSDVPADIQAPEAFRSALQTALDAHCRCDFSDSAQALFPLGVEGSGEWTDTAESCLGRTEVLSMERGSDDFVAIYLAAEERRRHSAYIMVAHFVEGEWLFSWPTQTGESPP